jgi:hypothetical protein
MSSHYERNKEKYKAKAQRDWAENKEARYARRMERLRSRYQELDEYKEEQGCAECGEARPYVLQFHHIEPDAKESTISNLVNSASMDRVWAEVDKCVVLCANCHMALHYWERRDVRPDDQDGGPDS